jgi:hypothetical protein
VEGAVKNTKNKYLGIYWERCSLGCQSEREEHLGEGIENLTTIK